MQLSLYKLLTLILLVQLLVGYKKISKKDPSSHPAAELAKINRTVDKSVNYQTIDGFGFFGAEDVWWATQNLWSDIWGDKIINDLEITIWRNEWGYSDFWIGSANLPGALNFAMDIYSGLNYGNMQAWVWWYGSEARRSTLIYPFIKLKPI